METEMFDDLMLSLNQALDYAKGDTTKARSVAVEIPDEEIDQSYLIYEKITKMSELDRQRVAGYVDGLLESAVG